MTQDENIFQILVMAMVGPKLQCWYEGEDAAKAALLELNSDFPGDQFWIEEGTDYIYKRCKGCQTVHCSERSDHYGISTGHWCDKCYDDPSKYTYRKDAYYDPLYAGERMEPEDDY